MTKPERIAEDLYYQQVEETIGQFNNNGKRTVVMFCDAYFPCVDGVVKVVDNLAKRLAKKSNVIVVVPKDRGKTVRSNDYLVIGVKSIYLKKFNYDSAVPAFDGKLKGILSKIRVDVIHVHSPFLLAKTAVWLKKRTGAPMVATFHSQYKKDVFRATKSKLLTDIAMSNIMRAFKLSDEVWTMHEASAKTLGEDGYKGKVKLMPNATDFIYPSDAEDRIKRFREKYGVTDQKTLLFVGRLVLQKNILFIADVLSRLKQSNVKFKMFFIGEGPDRETLEKRLYSDGVLDDCVLTGQLNDVSELEDYYLSADMVLFPSKYDVSSIIQIESAAMKTPCAFIEGSVTSCTITGGRNGFIFPDDCDRFAEGVKSALCDRDLLSLVSENAYKEVYVTWDKIVNDSYREYLRLCGAKPDKDQGVS